MKYSDLFFSAFLSPHHSFGMAHSFPDIIKDVDVISDAEVNYIVWELNVMGTIFFIASFAGEVVKSLHLKCHLSEVFTCWYATICLHTESFKSCINIIMSNLIKKITSTEYQEITENPIQVC